MMSDMGLRRRLAPRTSRAGVRAVVVVAVAVLAASCSAGDPPDEEPREADSAALRVETVSGADGLDEQTRGEIEGAVGDVLSDYVVEAFLGPFPRQEFVPAFEAFTGDAARDAAIDIDDLTAKTAADAVSVRATRLDARLSFLTRAGTVYAGTARVDFAFEATMEDGSKRRLVLDGRIMLDAESDEWRIFGYDVTFDDGIAEDAETSPDPDQEQGS